MIAPEWAWPWIALVAALFVWHVALDIRDDIRNMREGKKRIAAQDAARNARYCEAGDEECTDPWPCSVHDR